jgi:hypothetical protein
MVTLPSVVRAEPLPDGSQHLGESSTLSRLMNHPWTVGIGTAVISGIMVLLLTLWLT